MSNYSQSLIEDYRQTIKRLQKECTEKTNAIIALGEKWQEKYNKLEAEINKKELIFAGIETSNRLLIEKIEKIKKQKEKIEQTLTEIKKIAEPFCNACQEFEPEKKGSNCMYCNYGKILQKISECEVENDK